MNISPKLFCWLEGKIDPEFLAITGYAFVWVTPYCPNHRVHVCVSKWSTLSSTAQETYYGDDSKYDIPEDEQKSNIKENYSPIERWNKAFQENQKLFELSSITNGLLKYVKILVIIFLTILIIAGIVGVAGFLLWIYMQLK